VRVEDPAGERVVQRLVDHGAEPGHCHQVDPGLAEGLGQRHRVGVPIEVGPEAAEIAPVDQRARHAVAGGHL
jgi:hypothetical protein